MPTTTAGSPRLVILDSHGILFRAFFALGQSENPLMTSSGELTFATYGYVETLLRVIDDLKPTHLCAAWDAPGRTLRHEADERYKATRKRTPDDLIPQMHRVREVLDAFGIPVYELPGYEADDVAGTIAKRTAAEGVPTTIVTLDSDLVQLLGPNVSLYMYRPMRRGEVTEYNEASAAERYGFSPQYMTDFKALRGDTSDNVPGVKGIGEKTATALIRQFGPIESIYENIELVDKERTRKLLIEGEAEARHSKQMVTIHTDLPIDFSLEAAVVREYDQDRLIRLFRELEFRSLLERLPESVGTGLVLDEPVEEVASDYRVVTSAEALASLATTLREAGSFAVSALSTAGDTSHPLLLGLAFATAPGAAWYVPVGHAPRLDGEAGQLPSDEVLSVLGPLLEDPALNKVLYAAKHAMHQLARRGIRLRGVTHDISIIAFLLGETSNTLEALAGERLGVELAPYSSVTGTGRQALPLAQVEAERVGEIAAHHADILLRFAAPLEAELRDRGQWELYAEMELPLMTVLFEMEHAGIALDTSILGELSRVIVGEIATAEAEIYEIAGHEFNIGSPLQLSEILFGELALPKTRRTKGGYSTDQRALESLRPVHPIIDKIFAYRQLTKLKSTYLDALPHSVDEDGRIHTDFQQTVASTGRLSSTNPNLQNIPVRTDAARDIRRAFTAGGFDDAIFVGGDYSQIELRVLAHVTGDPGLINAFLADEDIHRATAATVYGVEPDAVTRQMRDVAKMVNFGIAYGMGEFGLASRTGMSREEAAAFIGTYYEKYPGIRDWQQRVLDDTRAKGYGETLFGRRRYLPAIRSTNFQVRSAAEREAINMPIQGTAADVIKIAMIRVAEEVQQRELRSRMILQVHDELIFEGPADEADDVAELLLRVMPASMEMAVPLKVEVSRGKRWSDLK